MKAPLRALFLVTAGMSAVNAETAEGDGIYAQFDTNRGVIEVVLEYEKAPKTVANFITLAEGTRARIDPNTGELTRTPLYDGQTFYSVVSQGSFFPGQPGTYYALTGSGTGDSNGGPGFTLPDEFESTLRHTGYNLSMATLANFTGAAFGSEVNRGPNSTGSQIMFIGNSILTRFDDVNSVFGNVVDLPSRLLVDAIMVGGAGTTTITGVTIERVGQAALDFDEHAQGLPSVGPPVGKFRVDDGAAYFDHDEPLGSGSFFSFSRSSDLSSWSPTTMRHIEPALGPEASTKMDDIGASKAFFEMFLTRHPGGLTPSSLANRTLVLETAPPNVETFTFVFDGNGTGGTSAKSGVEEEESITSVSYDVQGYGAYIEISSSNSTAVRAQIGFDSEDVSDFIGRHYLEESAGGGFWVPKGNGTATLSK